MFLNPADGTGDLIHIGTRAQQHILGEPDGIFANGVVGRPFGIFGVPVIQMLFAINS